jgi:hypothetical protein
VVRIHFGALRNESGGLFFLSGALRQQSGASLRQFGAPRFLSGALFFDKWTPKLKTERSGKKKKFPVFLPGCPGFISGNFFELEERPFYKKKYFFNKSGYSSNKTGHNFDNPERSVFFPGHFFFNKKRPDILAEHSGTKTFGSVLAAERFFLFIKNYKKFTRRNLTLQASLPTHNV